MAKMSSAGNAAQLEYAKENDSLTVYFKKVHGNNRNDLKAN